jgi:hypothetical protein
MPRSVERDATNPAHSANSQPADESNSRGTQADREPDNYGAVPAMLVSEMSRAAAQLYRGTDNQ